MPKMNDSDYVNIKESAYNFILNTSKEEREKIVKSLMLDLKFLHSDSKRINASTMLYPNDIQILEEYVKDHNITNISKKLNIPPTILTEKIMEYKIYNFVELLENKPKFNELASMANNIDLEIDSKHKQV